MKKIALALATILGLAFASPVYAAVDSGYSGHDPDINVQQQEKNDFLYIQNGQG